MPTESPTQKPATAFPARGQLAEVHGNTVIFLPENSTYRLELQVTGQPITGPLNEPIQGLIRLRGRKLMTVPSGGNFVVPIVGPPRIVQGRVRHFDQRSLILTAGVNVIVEIPLEDSALDLSVGPVTINQLVNATVFPGGSFELTR
jgi:hypothetical protein